MNKFYLVALAAGLSSMDAQADTIGLFAGISGWNAGARGNVQSGPESIDVEDELGLGDDFSPMAYVAFEHPAPLLPNLRMQYTELSQSGSGRLSKVFDNVSFSGDVATDLDLTHIDFIAYWRLLDNVFNLDLGIQAKVFDGEVTIRQASGTTVESTTAIDDVVPLIYGGVAVDLPLTGLGVGATVAGMKYDGNQLLDVNARIHYDIAVMGVELGWRQMSLELDDVSDIDADVSISGPYLGVNVQF